LLKGEANLFQWDGNRRIWLIGISLTTSIYEEKFKNKAKRKTNKGRISSRRIKEEKQEEEYE